MFGRPGSALRQFLQHEAAGGIILMMAAAAALVAANSPIAGIYFGTLKTYVGGLSVLHWINDALMAVFFLLVGLEIKRELVAGQLSTWPQRILPGVAAAGGIIAPALFYVALNWQTPESLRGWAIPAATDIAFALGVLTLLGPRVPISLKVFLTAIAIIDDLAAVAIIAALYTTDLAVGWLLASVVLVAVLAFAGRSGITHLGLFAVAGAILWFCVFSSGVHATLAGVALAFTIPIRTDDHHHSSLHRMEHVLHPWVAYFIVPVFGFANAGVSLTGVTLGAMLAPVPAGIAAGLFFGKQIGVFLTTWAVIKMKWARPPDHASIAQIYGVSMLCGIGFTMSLFIGLLAFPDDTARQDGVKIGVLAGSLLSATFGALVLSIARNRSELINSRSR